MQCDAMQCNRFRNWEDFRLTTATEAVSAAYNIIPYNACTPEGRPTKQATTLDHLHQARHFFSSQLDGILSSQEYNTLSLHTLRDICTLVAAQPCMPAMLFRTRAGTSKRSRIRRHIP
jgi:hypothetical protein